MAKPVRVTITGPSEGSETAPSGEDFLGQFRDILEMLKGVERQVEFSGTNELVWRVTDAQMNSPISLELTPYGHGPAANTAARVERVERAFANGLRALRRGEPRPPFFTDEIVAKARKLHDRVLNGLSETIIAFDPAVEDEPVVIDSPAARYVEKGFERARAAGSIPYTELGSIEGYVTKPELDGYHRAILRFKARLGGAEIKAFASGHAFRQVEALRLSDIWEGVRVRVYGAIHYKALGVVEQINATGIELLDTEPLPGIDDIVDPTFTGGLSTEEFLRELRGDD
jgi:hypothetical protein